MALPARRRCAAAECALITRRTYPLRMCYCVTKLHRCFHYEVDSDLVLHSNCRCSKNVDVATDKFWLVVFFFFFFPR